MSDLVITATGLLAPDREVNGARVVREVPAPEGVSARALRRMSRLGRLALAAVHPILSQDPAGPGADLGLVVGTGLADLDETATFLDAFHTRGERFASPIAFQRSLHGAPAGELAILYGLTGYNLTVTQGLHSGVAALYAAALALRSGRCDRCLCVAVDSATDALRLAQQALGDTSMPGEGAAALLLERASAGLTGPRLQRVDLGEAQRAAPPTNPALGVHGAADLMAVVLAVRGQGDPPPGVWFTP